MSRLASAGLTCCFFSLKCVFELTDWLVDWICVTWLAFSDFSQTRTDVVSLGDWFRRRCIAPAWASVSSLPPSRSDDNSADVAQSERTHRGADRASYRLFDSSWFCCDTKKSLWNTLAIFSSCRVVPRLLLLLGKFFKLCTCKNRLLFELSFTLRNMMKNIDYRLLLVE